MIVINVALLTLLYGLGVSRVWRSAGCGLGVSWREVWCYVGALLAMGEIRALTKEARGAGETVRAHRIAAEKAGQTPRYCPPKGAPRMGSEEFLKRLSAIPQDDRAKINMLEAMNRILAVKFPCKSV